MFLGVSFSTAEFFNSHIRLQKEGRGWAAMVCQWA